MIYTNIMAESHDTEAAMHLWLDGMIDESDEDERGLLVPSLTALCGAHLEPTDEDPQPYVEPANETWAESLVDLLGDKRLCEECRTRAAVYFDRQEDVTLTANTHGVPECPECESNERTATITNIVQREDKTVVERTVTCNECDHKWEDHVDMGGL